jgi:hypothetical protein
LKRICQTETNKEKLAELKSALLLVKTSSDEEEEEEEGSQIAKEMTTTNIIDQYWIC